MSRRGWRTAFACAVALGGCNEGLQPTLACRVGICGTVTFRGTVPGSTAAVYVVAYQVFPQSRNDLFQFQPPLLALQRLPLDRTSAFYAVPVPNGRYEWVLAAWVDTAFTLANADSTLQEAGFYRDGADTTRFGSGIVVVNGMGTDSINFTIDFGNRHRICTYFPPCR